MSHSHPDENPQRGSRVRSVAELESSVRGRPTLERLAWIDDRLFWTGRFRRVDLARTFGISDPQASNDISTYSTNSRTPPILDHRSNWHLAPNVFSPLFPVETKSLERWLVHPPGLRNIAFVDVTLPDVSPDPMIVRPLLAASEIREPVLVRYQSMSSGEATDRVLCPHSVIKASRRLYLRAWDESRERFASFAFNRFLRSAPSPGSSWVPIEADRDWRETIDVVLVPNPSLTAAQAAVVRQEYGMMDGCLVVPTRRALAIFVLTELGLVDMVRAPGHNLDGKVVIVENSEELRKVVFQIDAAGKL